MLANEGGKRYCSVREAYGKALAELGRTNESVVVLEADVGGSTKSSLSVVNFRNGISIWVSAN